VTLVELATEWWNSQRDTQSLRRFLESRNIDRLARGAMSLVTVLLGVVGTISLASSSGAQGTIDRSVVVVVNALALLWAVRWNVGAWPSFRESVAFLVFADVAIVVICLSDANTLAGVSGAAALVLLGTFTTFFLGPRVLVVHLGWCCVAIGVLAARVAVDPQFDVAIAVAKALVLLAVVVVIPVMIELGIHLIRVDADQSLTDPLTGLANRRGLHESVTRLRDQPRPYLVQHPCAAAIVLDLDKFKRINDQWGHQTGDEVLARTAQRLRRTCGPTSAISRYGGEEFLVFDLYPDIESVLALAHAIRIAVAADHPRPSVTASVGVAMMSSAAVLSRNRGHVDEAVGHAVDRADSAMYRAKRLGGNCIEVDDEGLDPPPLPAVGLDNVP